MKTILFHFREMEVRLTQSIQMLTEKVNLLQDTLINLQADLKGKKGQAKYLAMVRTVLKKQFHQIPIPFISEIRDAEVEILQAAQIKMREKKEIWDGPLEPVELGKLESCKKQVRVTNNY
jgi:hypothetical protein